jgi:hypothetical protein
MAPQSWQSVSERVSAQCRLRYMRAVCLSARTACLGACRGTECALCWGQNGTGKGGLAKWGVIVWPYIHVSSIWVCRSYNNGAALPTDDDCSPMRRLRLHSYLTTAVFDCVERIKIEPKGCGCMLAACQSARTACLGACHGTICVQAPLDLLRFVRPKQAAAKVYTCTLDHGA